MRNLHASALPAHLSGFTAAPASEAPSKAPSTLAMLAGALAQAICVLVMMVSISVFSWFFVQSLPAVHDAMNDAWSWIGDTIAELLYVLRTLAWGR